MGEEASCTHRRFLPEHPGGQVPGGTDAGTVRALFEAGSAHETLSGDTRWPLHERAEPGEVGLVRRSHATQGVPGSEGQRGQGPAPGRGTQTVFGHQRAAH